MKIVELKAQNVKRLIAAHIRPDGNIVTITGANGAGKSTAIDCIAYAIGGQRLCPEEPIRQGEDSAQVQVMLDDGMTVIRKWTKNKNTTLEVRDGQGAPLRSPQAILEKLYGALTFDPVAFDRMKPADQRNELLKLLRIEQELDNLTKKEESAKARRADTNREIKRLNGAIQSIAIPAGLPSQEINVEAMLQQIKDAEEQREKHAQWMNASNSIRLRGQSMLADIARQEADITTLQEKLLVLQQSLEAAKQVESQLREEYTTHAELEPEKGEDMEPLRRKIADAHTINTTIAEANRREKMKLQREEQEKNAAALESLLVEIQQERIAILQNAKWPIPGLGFNETGVTYNELPYEQASSAERIRASMAIAIAANPTLRVLLIRDGSLLDKQSMQLIAEMAQEKDYQIWIERIEDGSPSVIIEDGQVSGACVVNNPG